jgi:hypothetical protein
MTPISIKLLRASGPTLAHHPHWQTRAFHNFLKVRAHVPFGWGQQDCALFAADGIEACTGIDIAADFRGKYSDEASALAAIKTICGGSTVEDAAAYCAAKHGLPEWQYPLMAQRGDLVVLNDPDSDAPAPRIIAGLVHLSGRHIVAAGEKGLKRILIHEGNATPILRAWHV